MLSSQYITAIMEAAKIEPPKLPDMVMCGDHPSFTKTELNVTLDGKEKERPKDKNTLSYAKISPTTSQEGPTESRARLTSEHGLRRRARDPERSDVGPTARPAMQAFPFAALGSFRWPPYLLAVWVLVLVLTHVLHCLVNVLAKALPALKKCTQYFKSWSEESWKGECDMNQRVLPLCLAAVTAALYCVYFALYALHGVVLWAVEPLCADDARTNLDLEPELLDYLHTTTTTTSDTNNNVKQ